MKFGWQAFAAICSMLSLLSCAPYQVDEVDYTQPQTPAAVLLSDPQVYSRASLINDRRNELEYLNRLLLNSNVDENGKSKVQFAPEIIRDLKTIDALSLSLGLGVGNAASGGSKLSELNNQIDATKLEAQLSVLQKQVAAIQAAAPPQVRIPEPDLSTQDSVTPPATMPDVSSLQSAIKNVQSELAELEKNSAQNAIAPSGDYSALADPNDDFMDRQAYRRNIRAAIAESQLDDTHDSGGKALYRLQFQATVLPPSGDTRQWAATKIEISPPSLPKAEMESMYYNWLSYLSTSLSAAQSSSSHDYNYDRFLTQIGKRQFFDVIDLFEDTADPDKHYCLHHDTASDEQLRLIDSGTSDPEAERLLDSLFRWKVRKLGTYAVPEGLGVSVSERCGSYLGGDLITNVPSMYFFITEEVVKYHQEGVLRSLFSLESKGPPSSESAKISPWQLVPVSFCRALLSSESEETGPIPEFDTATTCDEFYKYYSSPNAAGGEVVNDDFSVRTYSVLPAELTQRLGVTTEASQSLQTALSIAGQVTPVVSGSLDAGYLAQSDARAEAISRQPLVVGFAGTDPHPNLYPKNYFGWLFGPHFVVSDSKHLALKHEVRSYGVTADVSVPGWWSKFELSAMSAWVSNWSTPQVINETLARPSMVSKSVQLPLNAGTFESLTNFIAAKARGIQYSQLYASNVTPNVIPSCASDITFEITGSNIWRASSVYLGGAKAKSITVLPDMNGIAAEFSMVDVFGATANSTSTVQVVPLSVSAEQGSAAPLKIYLVGQRTVSNGATSCQSPLLVPADSRTMTPTIFGVTGNEMCADSTTAVVALDGINLGHSISVVSDVFEDGPVHALVDPTGTRAVASLSAKNGKLRANSRIPIYFVAIGANGQKILSFPMTITVSDCKGNGTNGSSGGKNTGDAAKVEAPKLETGTAKTAKDQLIRLQFAIPESYSELKVGVRPRSDAKVAYTWSAAITNAIPGTASTVQTNMDLSGMNARPGDMLDVAISLKSNPASEPAVYPADKPLKVEQ